MEFLKASEILTNVIVGSIHTFTGKKIDPPNIYSGMTVSQLINFFSSTGYNARRLAEGAEIMRDMIRDRFYSLLDIGRGNDSDWYGQVDLNYD